MRRLLMIGLTLALIGVAAPARAQAPTTPDWTGDNAGWAAQPLVQEAEGRMTLLLAGPIKATYQRTAPESDRYWPWEDVIVADGLTRKQTTTTVTYTSDTKRCTRTISKKYPGSIKADRKARFTCKPKPADATDQLERIEGYRPTALIQATPGTTEVIGLTSAVQAPPARVFSGGVYASPDTRPLPLREAFYTFNADGLSIEWNECSSASDCRDYKLVLSSGDVPELPSMSSLRH